MRIGSPTWVQNVFLASLLWISMALRPTDALAWGQLGHETIAQIALGRLTSKTLGKLSAILGPETLLEASNYPDRIRGDRSKSIQDGQLVSNWHYLNIPDGLTYEQIDKNPNGDAYAAFQKMKKKLIDPKSGPADKLEAVRWIAHLVGDIHQPLHLGYAEDRGGNDCHIHWAGHKTNLHALIDAVMIDAWPANEILTSAAKISEKKKLAMARAPVREWIQESIALRRIFYPRSTAANPYDYCAGGEPLAMESFAKKYEAQIKPIIEKRILQAGVRLGAVLNEALGR